MSSNDEKVIVIPNNIMTVRLYLASSAGAAAFAKDQMYFWTPTWGPRSEYFLAKCLEFADKMLETTGD